MSKAVITRYTVDSGQRLHTPVRIAHVSDLHERDCDDILAMLKNERPDVIFVTGDTFERYDNRPQYDFERRPHMITSKTWRRPLNGSLPI